MESPEFLHQGTQETHRPHLATTPSPYSLNTPVDGKALNRYRHYGKSSDWLGLIFITIYFSDNRCLSGQTSVVAMRQSSHLFDCHQGASAHVLGLVAGGEGPQADLLALQPLLALPVGLLGFGMARQSLWSLGKHGMTTCQYDTHTHTHTHDLPKR
jgi:hypothetical protein